MALMQSIPPPCPTDKCLRWKNNRGTSDDTLSSIGGEDEQSGHHQIRKSKRSTFTLMDNNNNTTILSKIRTHTFRPTSYTQEEDATDEGSTLNDLTPLPTELDTLPTYTYSSSRRSSGGTRRFYSRETNNLDATDMPAENRRIRRSQKIKMIHTDKYSNNQNNTSQDLPHSIIREMDPPWRYDGNFGAESQDFETQVQATDILANAEGQTDKSLALRCEKIPSRCPGKLRNKTGRKNSTMCDCDEPVQIPTDGSVEDFNMQVCTGDINPSDVCQTGPSLTAVGPFCAFDYFYKKANCPKGDCYQECLPPWSPEKCPEAIHCEKAPSRHATCQAVATDILASEWIQTGDSLIENSELIHRPPKSIKVFKASRYTDQCGRVQDLDAGTRELIHRDTQVTATDICISSGAQTGGSLLQMSPLRSALGGTRTSDELIGSARGFFDEHWTPCGGKENEADQTKNKGGQSQGSSVGSDQGSDISDVSVEVDNVQTGTTSPPRSGSTSPRVHTPYKRKRKRTRGPDMSTQM